jgi:hypothetical protein
MSTAALVGALISGLVLLGVATLVLLAWVDDRRREDEEAFASSRPAAGRVVAQKEAPAPEPPTDDAPPVLVLPPEPEQTIDLEAAAAGKTPEAEHQQAETSGAPAKPRAPGPAGAWHIRTLQNGEGS